MLRLKPLGVVVNALKILMGLDIGRSRKLRNAIVRRTRILIVDRKCVLSALALLILMIFLRCLGLQLETLMIKINRIASTEIIAIYADLWWLNLLM